MKKFELREESREVDYQVVKAYVAYGIFADDVKIGDAEVYVPLSEEEAEDFEDCDPDDDWVHCNSLKIYEDFQNRGYGTQTLETLAEIYGCYTITPENDGSKRLYERLGYEDLSWDDAYYTDQGYGVFEIR